MISRFVPILILTLIVSATASVAALAQSPLCDRYRAELASLGEGGPDPRARQAEAAAQRQRAELDRTRGYMAQIGCNRGGFVFFNQSAPAECGGLQARVRQMEANLDQLLRQSGQQGGGPGVDIRRRQLLAAIDQNCRPGAEPAQRQPGFFERLFGVPAQPALPDSPFEEAPQLPPEGPREARLGGARTVCVRTCDGFFFPLPTGGREGAGELCQALCPATETQVFYMPTDGDIERAAGAGGRPYTDLPNASRYKKSFDASCACRRDGETWVQALRNAEDLLEKRKTDIIVTAAKAEELSRPKADTRTDARGKPNDPRDRNTNLRDARNPRGAAIVAEPDAEPPADKAVVPTAGGESAGIGPQTIAEDKTVGQREGQFREFTDADGVKRKVRVVAPNIFVDPSTRPR
jgi:Protein of unknown function (DUF2865)